MFDNTIVIAISPTQSVWLTSIGASRAATLPFI